MALYLITGIAGFIGSSLARELLSRGQGVRGLDNFCTGKRENLDDILARLDLHEADITDLEAMHRASEEATRDAMHSLAADTGGFLVTSTNDLRSGLRRMLADTESYYVLAYEPTNTKHDGLFRRIEVRVPGSR